MNFLKGVIIWFYDVMILDEKIRLNIYIINGIRNKLRNSLIFLCGYIYKMLKYILSI